MQFVPECHVDAALARVLLAGRLSFINHQHGIPSVDKELAERVAKSRGARFVVGMVDRDKKFGAVKSLHRFTQVVQARTGPACRCGIYQDPAHPSQYLLVLEPACDTWLFEAAQAAGLDMAEFKLPTTLPGFMQAVKDGETEENPQLEKLLHAIRRARPSGYRELANFVADVLAAAEESGLRQAASARGGGHRAGPGAGSG